MSAETDVFALSYMYSIDLVAKKTLNGLLILPVYTFCDCMVFVVFSVGPSHPQTRDEGACPLSR